MALVTLARYRHLTGDTTSIDGDVEDALATSQKLVEEWLRRPLESAVRTEDVKVHGDGYVYPQATPVTTPPSGYSTELDGVALSGGSTTWSGLVDSGTTSLTYTGGWTDVTVPDTIEDAIARTAERQLTSPSEVPGGATSVTLGDASVTFKAPSGGTLPDTARRALRSYRRRRL